MDLTRLRISEVVEDSENLDEQIRQHEVSIAHLRRKKNRLLPIYVLPTEIMAQILLLTLPSHREPHSAQTVVAKLCSVSYAWNELVTHTPSFWISISSDFQIPLVERMIRMSHRLPLTIHVYEDPKDAEWQTKEKDFWHIVESQLDRCREFECNDNSSAIKKLQRHLPILESLDIGERQIDEEDESEAPPGEPPRFNPPIDFAPSLKRLSMKNVNHHWKIPPVFKNLSRLDLTLVFNIPWDAFFAFMAASPSLTSLDLEFVMFQSDGPAIPTESIIVMPALEHIGITSMDGEQISNIIKAINPPRCSSLLIAPEENGNPLRLPGFPDWVSATLKRNIQDPVSHRFEGVNASFELRPNSLSLHAAEVQLETYGPLFREETIIWMSSFLPSIPATWLLRIEVLVESAIVIQLEALQSLRCKVELWLSQQDAHVELLTWLWGNSAPNAAVDHRFLISKLKIWLNDGDVDQFMDLLSSRYRGRPSASSIQDLWIGLPHPNEGIRERATEILSHQQVRCLFADSEENPSFVWYIAEDRDEGDVSEDGSEDGDELE